MTTLRRLVFMAMAALLPGGDSLAQAATSEPVTWSFSAYAFAYILPDDDDFLVPTFTADRDWLHLEARYQYENLDTGSLWAGYNFSVGHKVTFEATAMLGAVFGATDGIAPGYKALLGWSKLALYSEGEYVFDTNDSADSFLYSWSELSWAPVEWSRFGLVVQRTKVYETDRDIQRGVLVGFSVAPVDFTAYVLNPDDSSPTLVVAFGLVF